MGLLSWLFNDDGGKTLEGFRNGSIQIRTENGVSYDKASTLAAFDKLNGEILKLEELYAKKQRGEPYVLHPSAAPAHIATCNGGGFNMKDVEAYLTELDYRIVELRAEL